jgi:two-component system response regulator RegA
MQRTLQRRGHEALGAANGQEAMALAKAEQPDHVVLDLRLDRESGLQLIEPLLAILPGLRIVVLTGYASLATAVKAVKLGAVDYLAKPVGADAILRALDEQAGSAVEEDADFRPTPLKQLEWEHLQRVLEENGGNISATARQLRMHRRTLQRKLQKRPDLKRELD